jgi:hypothetical protein
MNDAERIIARYERAAPVVIVAAVVITFLVAGGALVAVPVVLLIGVALAWLKLKGAAAVRATLNRVFSGD